MEVMDRFHIPLKGSHPLPPSDPDYKAGIFVLQVMAPRDVVDGF
jgi:hypothetical protein